MDLAQRRGGNPGEDAGQIPLRIELMTLGAGDQRIERRRGLAGTIVADE